MRDVQLIHLRGDLVQLRQNTRMDGRHSGFNGRQNGALQNVNTRRVERRYRCTVAVGRSKAKKPNNYSSELRSAIPRGITFSSNTVF